MSSMEATTWGSLRENELLPWRCSTYLEYCVYRIRTRYLTHISSTLSTWCFGIPLVHHALPAASHEASYVAITELAAKSMEVAAAFMEGVAAGKNVAAASTLRQQQQTRKYGEGTKRYWCVPCLPAWSSFFLFRATACLRQIAMMRFSASDSRRSRLGHPNTQYTHQEWKSSPPGSVSRSSRDRRGCRPPFWPGSRP